MKFCLQSDIDLKVKLFNLAILVTMKGSLKNNNFFQYIEKIKSNILKFFNTSKKSDVLIFSVYCIDSFF